jgi:hypothetical protein
MTIRKQRESQPSILMRILANYFQMITSALSFDYKFPNAITSAFEPVQIVGASSEVFLSFD